jgi:hypothetical protein
MPSSSSRPSYVVRGGEQIYPPPAAAQNTAFYGFLLEADADAIQTHVCDLLFNEPSGGALDFVPFGSWAMLGYDSIARLVATDPPANEWGWIAESEAAIWVLMEERKSGELYWTLPYIFVDNGYALTIGREVYGFPKAMGRIQMPYSPEHASFLGTDTIVMPEYTSFTQGVPQQIWATRLTEPGPGGIPGLYDNVGDFVDAIGDIVRGNDKLGQFDWQTCRRLWAFLKDLVQREAPMVFLKQFRAADSPTEACYQAVIATTIEMTAFHGARLLNGTYAVDIGNPPSHPVRRDLGIVQPSVTSALSFYANFDFRLGFGKELWRAP